MSKITKSAQGKSCTARIPRVCNGNPETTVWAHINSVRWGAGKGRKADDIHGLYACSSCHDVIDRRVKSDHDPYFIEICAHRGHHESLEILRKEGLL